MSQINNLAGSILQSHQVQRQQANEKDRLVRRAQDKIKNSALLGDELQHQVESSEETLPVNPDEKHERQFKRGKHRDFNAKSEDDDENKPHLDMTA